MRLLTLGALTLLCVSQGSDACVLELFGTSWIFGPSTEKTLEELQDISRSNSMIARVAVYGRSVEGRPLFAIKVGRGDCVGPRNAVLITGATHGNENTNIPMHLVRWLLSKNSTARDFIDDCGIAYVVPIFNPDGYSRNRRRNAEGIDLNRDFEQPQTGHAGFQSPETNAFVSYLERELARDHARLALTIDYHCCSNALLYPWSYADVALPSADWPRYEEVIALARSHIDWFLRAGTARQINGYYAEGSSKDYYYWRFGAVSFTFESVMFFEEWRAPNHIDWWTDLLRSIK
jgi:carboxypeptidase T